MRLALLLVFAPPLMLPLHAQAQTTIQLVSNIEESHVGNLFVGEVSGEQRAFAQKFTTGTSGEGYILRAVRLPATAILLTVEPRISIYDEANGRPGQIVHELSNPNSLGGSAAKRFGAESDAKLERETNYYVVVEAVATGGGTPTDNYNMGSTNSRTQTSAESTSWTIGDRRHDNINAGGWIEAPAASAVIRMRIDGYARPDTTLGELSITDANGAYAVAVDPVFAQDSVQYTAQAANGVETLTVVARANNAQATVEFLDTDNNPIADADDNKEGHQIAIDVGSNFFSVLVTAEQDAQKEYEVSVTRAAAGGALFASLVPAPSHDNVNLARRHVDLHLSTEVWKTIDHMRDWVLQTTNGTVESVERVTSISGAQGDLSAHWRIALRPVYAHRTMTLKVTPVPTSASKPCGHPAFLCAPGAKPLTNAPTLELPAVGSSTPTGLNLRLRIDDASQAENKGRFKIAIKLRNSANDATAIPTGRRLSVRLRTVDGGTATEGEDYVAADHNILIPAGHTSWNVDLVNLLPDTVDDPGETVKVEISEAWILDERVLRLEQLGIQNRNAAGDTVQQTGRTVTATLTILAPEGQTGSTQGTITLNTPTTDADAGRGGFTIMRGSAHLSHDVCVRFETLTTGTATAGEDFHPKLVPVWMHADEQRRTIYVQAKRDNESDDGETVVAQISQARRCNDPATVVAITNATRTWTVTEPTGATARFFGPTMHDGKTRFTMNLESSDPVRNTEDNLRDRAIKISGGNTTKVMRVNPDHDLWEIEIEPSGSGNVVVTIEGEGRCGDPGTLCTEDGEPFEETVTATVVGPDGEAPLVASFEDAPAAHDGASAFNVYLRFSEAPAGVKNINIKGALAIAGGKILRVRVVGGAGGDEAHRRVEIEPDGDGDVQLSLLPTTDCAVTNALCTADGRKLESLVSLAIPGPASAPPLTASFENAPVTHDGMNFFTVSIVFSEAPAAMDDQAIEAALQVQGGWTRSVGIVDGDPARRAIRIKANGVGPVTLSFEATADCANAHALCTAAGGRLEAPVEITVNGPPVLSVSNARAEEGPGATLDFVVSLSHAFGARIKAPYEVEDGTATEGADYAKPGGQGQYVVFAPGEIEKTLSIAVLEDELDEGNETMKLWAVSLETINAQGERMVLTHGTGTIVDPGAAATAAPLTASFEQVPDEHDGASAFNAYLRFSEAPADVKNIHIKGALTIAGGKILRVRVVGGVNGDEAHRRVEIEPAGDSDVRLSLLPTTDCAATNALCSAAGGKLEEEISVTIPGPVAISVADAEVEEAAGAVLAFDVTLDRARHDTVTVDYATEDGTGTAGEDYTAASGTLTFAAGETAKTVEVAVLDDSHDEGNETLVLRLSNPSGARIADGEATGTIENTDSMPRAWLARFGRTASVHVFDAVEERLRGGAPQKSWAQLGGYRIGPGPDVSESVSRLAPDRQLWDEVPETDPRGDYLTLNQVLLGSAFHMVSNLEDTGSRLRLSAWGRVATSGFDGREDQVSFDGTVTTATLGVDGTYERWLTGLAVAYSRGEGDYSMGDTDAAELEGTLTSLHPYAAWRVSDRVTLWGLVGYGSGSLRLVRRKAMSTDLTLRMGAVGVRGEVLSQSRALTLAIRSDALWTQTSSGATAGLAATESEASRLRVVLEGSRAFEFRDGGSFTPVLEVGLRRDGGDAEEGSGVEVGGRLGYASAFGLSLEVSLRALVAHESEDYEEWGASGSLRFDPGQRGVGLTASVSPQWGLSSGGVGELWSRPDTRGLAGGNGLPQPMGRVHAELGYGVAMLNSRGILTPYARVALSEGADQAWHLGTRLALRESLDVSLEATRRHREGERAAHDLALLATLPW